MTKQITVQYVNAPKTPKGPGSIKTNDGTYFKCWKSSKVPGTALLADFEVGGEYEIEYTTEEYNGKPQYTVAKIVSGGGETGTPANGRVSAAKNGTDAPSSYQSPADRSARIERQHSQEMALRVMVLGKSYEIGTDTVDVIRKWTDYFQSDLNNSPSPTVESVSTDIEQVNGQLQEASGW